MLNTGEWITILETRPPRGYKVDILLENRQTKGLHFEKILLKPKPHLAMAITCGMLAL
jgi:hypothetical protein